MSPNPRIRHDPKESLEKSSFITVSETLIKLLFEKLQVVKKSYEYDNLEDEFSQTDSRRTQIQILIPVEVIGKYAPATEGPTTIIEDYCHKIDTVKMNSSAMTINNKWTDTVPHEFLDTKAYKNPILKNLMKHFSNINKIIDRQEITS